MVNSKLYIVFFVCMLMLVSCECIPSIVSPEIKEPTEFASVNFINAIPDYDSIDVWEGNRSVLSDIDYNNPLPDYKKITSGRPNIRMQSSTDLSIFYNSMLDFEKDKKYSVIAYGTKRRYNILMMSEIIANYNQSNAYIRFINVSPDSPVVRFDISSYPINPVLSFKSFTDYNAIPIGSFSISAVDTASKKELIKINNVDLKSGKVYKVILEGFSQQDAPKKLQFKIVEYQYQ